MAEEHEQKNYRKDMQERHPGWPKIELLFYFAPHSNNADMEDIGPHLAEADVIFYENIGRNQKFQEILEAIASPNPSMTLDDILDKTLINGEPIRGTHNEPLVRGLYKSGKTVGTLDIGKTDEEMQMGHEIFVLKDMEFPKNMTYPQALYFLKDLMTEFTNRQVMREQIMTDRFEEELTEIFDRHPELLERKDIKVVISMGSVHTTLRHSFTEKGIESKKEFSSGKSHTYSYTDEVARSIVYNKEPSDDLLSRACAENVIADAINDSVHYKEINDIARTDYIRRYVSKLDEEEMEFIYRMWDIGKASLDELDVALGPRGHSRLPRSSEDIIQANRLAKNQRRNVANTALLS